MLTGQKIKELVKSGLITIDPFDEKQCGPNSYDVRIGDHISQVEGNERLDGFSFVNLSKPSKVVELVLTQDDSGMRGFLLQPNRAYLAHTIEVIGSNQYVPVYHGRSSTARHGLMTHYAGLGDLGWRGQLVLELVNMTGYPMFMPVGVRVGQVSFHQTLGDIKLYNSTYQGQRGIVSAKGLT